MPTVIITGGTTEWESAFSGTLPRSERPGKVSIRCTAPIQFPGGTPFIPSMTFPYAPNSISFSELADNYEQLNRPGREPMLFRSEQRLMSVELSLLMTADQGKGINSVEFSIEWLRLIARSDKDISLIGLGELVTGRLFRIVDVSAKSVRMNVKQEITIAEVGISLVQVHYDERQKIPGLIVIKDVPPPQQQSTGGRTSAGGNSRGELWPEVRDIWTSPPI
jgi:hypothetical protein